MPPSEPARGRTDEHCPRVRQRLQACSEVRRLTNRDLFLGGAFAGQIAHDRHPGGNADASGECDISICRELGDRIDERETGTHRLFRIILVCLRIAEVDQHTIAHIAAYDALMPAYDFRDTTVVRANQRPHVLGIEPCGKRRRTHQIAEHNRQVASLGFVR